MVIPLLANQDLTPMLVPIPSLRLIPGNLCFTYKDLSRLNEALKEDLSRLDGRHGRIKFPAIKAIKDKRCVIEVFKCVHGLAPNLFENYFCKQNHTKGTRGNNANLVVPPIRTEAARKTFFYQGTQIYNKLPITLKTETSILRFKTSFKTL